MSINNYTKVIITKAIHKNGFCYSLRVGGSFENSSKSKLSLRKNPLRSWKRCISRPSNRQKLSNHFATVEYISACRLLKCRSKLPLTKQKTVQTFLCLSDYCAMKQINLRLVYLSSISQSETVEQVLLITFAKSSALSRAFCAGRYLELGKSCPTNENILKILEVIILVTMN